jgi:DNA-binding LacI/PurR family transcriptional regulator
MQDGVKKKTASPESITATVTLRDVAKALGISHSTASRALNDNRNISLSLRQQVQKVARQMGYRPNPIARVLGHRRQLNMRHPIGAEIAWINFWDNPADLRRHKEFDLYWKGAYHAAEQYGYRLEEFNCSGNAPASRLESILMARNICGLLIPPHRTLHRLAGWDRIDWKKFVVVRFGYSVDIDTSSIVAGNHVTSGLLAFGNIRRLGYERIGFVSSQEVTTRFKAGFLMKQLDTGVKQQVPLLILPAEHDHHQQIDILEHWLKKYRPDAILTDVADLREILEQLDLRIPGDIGLAAISILDGKADAGIDQNSERIGEVSVATLISLMTQAQYNIQVIAHEILVESKWVDGQSLPQKHS